MIIAAKKYPILKVLFLSIVCFISFFIANDINYAAPNAAEVTIEEYENNVKALPVLNASQTMDKFNSGEGFYFYIGRPTCYYCREFSPVLKEFSRQISQPIYYYNVDGGDWGREIGQFLVDRIEFQGTPTLAYVRDGKAVVQQVGSGPTINELLEIFADYPH
ncbi:thiol reductase thioredoxin [Paenibacillus tritici]|uniref:Thiol reductase thioredoxin n=1 Tax=Paenibacillus tritici TaxID=1873425 RepID=A0ABX2DUV7_9BACL|nr:thioredoxin domain-containing protein [Paenibacillus tritici]NQX48478.1 thiol reductase thioredoxin [Paenibacillus tritici]